METKRVHLWDPYKGAAIDGTVLRLAAESLADVATGYGTKRGLCVGDELFEEVTEGRAHWAKYSACGDLASWLLFMLGVRDEKLVNRTNDGGRVPWRMGKNISSLVYASGKAWTNYARAKTARATDPFVSVIPRLGDIVYVGEVAATGKVSREHVCVMRSTAGNRVKTYDYGQVSPVTGLPAGFLRESAWLSTANTLMIGDRRVLGWVDLERLSYSESAQVPVDFEHGVVDDCPYYDSVAPQETP